MDLLLNYDEYVVRSVKVPKDGKPLFRTVTDACKVISTVVGVTKTENKRIEVEYIDPEIEGALI